MKKFSRLFLVGSLATVLFLSYSLAKAQDDPKAGASCDPSTMQDKGHGDWGKWGKGHDFLKKQLGLTDDQEAQLKAAMKEQMEANKPLRDEAKIDLDTLQKLVDTKASDSDIQNTLDKLKHDQKAVREAQERSVEKIASILTPTQKAKWLLSKTHRRFGHGRGHGKWGQGQWDHKGKIDHKKHSKKDAQAQPADTSSDTSTDTSASN